MACQLAGLAETMATVGRIVEDGSIDFSSLYEDECLVWGNNTPDHHAHGKHVFSRRSNQQPGVIGSVFVFEQLFGGLSGDAALAVQASAIMQPGGWAKWLASGSLIRVKRAPMASGRLECHTLGPTVIASPTSWLMSHFSGKCVDDGPQSVEYW